MTRIALWRVAGTTLNRLTEAPLDLEVLLENWIEADPSLLQPGLTIVGRQFTLAGSGRVDLLGLDLNGFWAAIEVKKGAVDREALAQTLDYAAAIAEMPTDELRRQCDEYLGKFNKNIDAVLRERQILRLPDPPNRDVAVTIVGTGRLPNLERIASFLNRFELPMTVVSFDVFASPEGGHILAREITESEGVTGPPPGITAEDVLRLADSAGTGPLLRRLFDAATQLQLYPRAWKTSIMFAPPTRRNRMLFTAWAAPINGKLSVYVGNEPFAEFFPVSLAQANAALGPEGWRTFGAPELDRFIDGLRRLLGVSNDASSAAS